MPDPIDLTKALRTWAFRKNIKPAEFRDRMDWSYQYAWNVISPRGKHTFRHEAWGRFIHAYGLCSLEELFRIAGVDPNKEKEPHG